MRPRTLGLIAGAVALATATVVVMAHRLDPARQALEAYNVVPERADAGCLYLEQNLRARGWVLNAPGQPNGNALFVTLPDAELGPERILTRHELESALKPISGLTWKPKEGCWSGSGGRSVPLAQMDESLRAVCRSASDARTVLSLLTGNPAPGTGDVGKRLMAGDLPEAIHLRPFSGRHGSMLTDLALPSSEQVRRGYEGNLVHFAGEGWPREWRLGHLRESGR